MIAYTAIPRAVLWYAPSKVRSSMTPYQLELRRLRSIGAGQLTSRSQLCQFVNVVRGEAGSAMAMVEVFRSSTGSGIVGL